MEKQKIFLNYVAYLKAENKVLKNNFKKQDEMIKQLVNTINNPPKTNNKQLSLKEIIKKIYFNNDLYEYNNIFITNMKDDIAYIFNGKQFIAVNKNEILNKIVYIYEINITLEKYKLQKLEKFLNILNDYNTEYTNISQKVYPNYKAYKINKI
jgi:hypothetical protein